MPMLEIDGGRLHYDVHGTEGRWIFLVVGLNGRGAFWDEQVRYLARFFRVVVHDHRGCGDSTCADARCSIDLLQGDVLALMDALGVERAILIGHSLGGMVCQRLAIDHPGRVAALVISGSFAKADQAIHMLIDFRIQVLRQMGCEAYIRLQTLLTLSTSQERSFEGVAQSERSSLATLPPTDVLVSRLQTVADFECEDLLHRIEAPTLVMAATDDNQAPPVFARAIADRIPGSQLVILPTGGHFFPRTESQQYNNVLSAFLDRQHPGV